MPKYLQKLIYMNVGDFSSSCIDTIQNLIGTRILGGLCLSSQVVTGIYSTWSGFQVPSYLRCHKLDDQWAVNASHCRSINIYRYQSTSPPSPLNDPGYTGTADSVWGAQCGGWRAYIEAMVSLGVDYTNRMSAMRCCAVYRLN
jgi:hypothetical protein